MVPVDAFLRTTGTNTLAAQTAANNIAAISKRLSEMDNRITVLEARTWWSMLKSWIGGFFE